MLELKPFSATDAPRVALLRNHPVILANGFDGTPDPYTVAAAEAFIASQAPKQPAENLAIWLAGELVGSIGLWQKEDVFRLSAGLGYWVGAPYWGKGVATEAIGLFITYAFATFNIVRLEAGVFAFNQPSMRALEKNGFYLESIRRQAVVKHGQIQDDYVWVKLKHPDQSAPYPTPG
ncbi:GNAT family N-acetyltransferase [Hymenobacter sp. J193]|uniref:GNAT family N-acetyltransferase n=1 Tax=Hymenobacter sp. J193 TaxID=2898429 RepID=UPI00215184ED|nr:GNAT family protein [Hymenobacter sp. J193]MCR5889958.1 GNAT family N-acetyltransferase [Hymenobacter sp. J193]